MGRGSIGNFLARLIRFGSLGVALLLVVLWVATSIRGWSCQWGHGGRTRDFGDYLGVRGNGGGVEFTRWHAVPDNSVPDELIVRYRWIGDRPLRAHFTTYCADAAGVLAAAPFVGDDPLGFARQLSQQRVNFHDYANDADIPYTVHMSVVRVRYWVLVAIAMLPAMPWLIWRYGWRKRRRLAAGLCVNCGYDLRAGHARCPECGHATAKTTHNVFRLAMVRRLKPVSINAKIAKKKERKNSLTFPRMVGAAIGRNNTPAKERRTAHGKPRRPRYA